MVTTHQCCCYLEGPTGEQDHCLTDGLPADKPFCDYCEKTHQHRSEMPTPDGVAKVKQIMRPMVFKEEQDATF